MNKLSKKIAIYLPLTLLAIGLNASTSLAIEIPANQCSGFLGSSAANSTLKDILLKTATETLIKAPTQPNSDRYKKPVKQENPVSETFKPKHKMNKTYILGGAEVFPL